MRVSDVLCIGRIVELHRIYLLYMYVTIKIRVYCTLNTMDDDADEADDALFSRVAFYMD